MDYRLTEPYDPENEDAPERDGVTCAHCGHFVADDDPDQEAFAACGRWLCDSCYDGSTIDPFDDADFDGGRE